MFDFDPRELLIRFGVYVIPLALSLTVHEWAHAWSAHKLGDDTAEREGRLTLNPLMHIDPLGTIILPLLAIPFGWARPVPVNPARFRRDVSMRMGMVLTAAAGPISNVVLSLLCSLTIGLGLRFGVLHLSPAIMHLLWTGMGMNILLAVFNLLPLLPLDGSRVVDGLMPARWEPTWQQFLSLGQAPLLLVIMLPRLIHVDLLAWPMNLAQTMMVALTDVIAGY